MGHGKPCRRVDVSGAEPMTVAGKHVPRDSLICVDEEYVCSTQPDGSRRNRGIAV